MLGHPRDDRGQGLAPRPRGKAQRHPVFQHRHGEARHVLADAAEEYSDGILHVTTRQDFQLHYVHIEDTPVLMRRLAASGITTREACGNSVRNVTACPLAGVCKDEAFDVTPYSAACAWRDVI